MQNTNLYQIYIPNGKSKPHVKILYIENSHGKFLFMIDLDNASDSIQYHIAEKETQQTLKE